MKNFTPEMSGREKENARIIKAYEIAKMVFETASTYQEAVEILDGAKRELAEAMLLSEPKIRDKPRDAWGAVLEMPEAQAAGME